MATLKSVSGGASVVVCNTCRQSGEAADGRCGGADLARALHHLRAVEPSFAGIAVDEMACLFACKDFCAVHLRAPGKMGYVLGRFTPDEAAARAILEFMVAYAASDIGEVPFALWPDGVKGHFITRTPPVGFVVE